MACRIAHASSQPSVLLLEAGDSNASAAHQSSAERFEAAFSPNSSLNWNYKTIPQNQLSGQEIDYSRGRGLGGSTAINFCGWVVGPRDDYDEWGRLVEDDSFNWINAKRCLDKISNLHTEIPDPTLRKYVDAKRKGTDHASPLTIKNLTAFQDHSNSGPLDLTYGDAWLPNVGDIFVAAEQSGLRNNTDVNSGNPIGMGMGSVCIFKGQRLTASTAYLKNPPSNLTILTNSAVANIIFQDKRAIGVKTIHGRTFHAKKEVIISGGAINSPQILMLSGVGPENELSKHGIPLIHHLPMVGQNLQDHCFSSAGVVMKRGKNTPASGQAQVPSPMGWFKLPSVLESMEYQALPEQMKSFLHKPTIPGFEIATVCSPRG